MISGGIQKRRFSDDRKEKREPKGAAPERRGAPARRGGKPAGPRQNKAERLPKDPTKAKEILDNKLIEFQLKQGINTEQLEARKKAKLDDQLKQFMSKAQEQKQPGDESKPAAEETTRQVVEGK